MKNGVWIGVLVAMLLLCVGLSLWLMIPAEAATRAQILCDGQLLHTLDLAKDQQITVTTPNGGVNVVTVRGGKIAVTEASCPDHYCMQRGFCNAGPQIVCLPNRLVIRFLGEQELDGVAG